MKELRIAQRMMKLYTPAISDTLDEMGYVNSSLESSVKPLKKGYKMAGPVITAKAEIFESYRPVKLEEWLKVMLKMLEDSKKGYVYVVETEGNREIASWGELMSNAARAKGAVGAITDGAARDTPKILEIKPPFQVFASSTTPRDAKGRMQFTDYNVPVKCGGVDVQPGDFAFADDDGVVIVPRDIAEDVVTSAEKRVKSESSFRASVRKGMSVTDAFRKYGVF